MTNSADLASCESADIQRRILELIEGASSIAISGHTSPDGDALGSVLGLGLSLMKFFPNKDIALLLADDDPVPRIYRFMEGSDRLVPASAYAGAKPCIKSGIQLSYSGSGPTSGTEKCR